MVTLLSPYGMECKNENPGLGEEKKKTPSSLGAKLNYMNSSEGFKVQNGSLGSYLWGVTGTDSPTCSVTKRKGN